jgi:hypothetical protein
MDNDANPPVAYMDCVKTFIEPNAPVGLFGPDSQAQFSIKMCYPNKPCPRPQVAIFKMYQDANEAGWELHWPGMRWLLVTDGKYGPAKFYKPPLQ